MPKYRKKPIVVEAFQVNAFTVEHYPEWFLARADWGWTDTDNILGMEIDTLEGTMSVSKGDYIIRGVADEIYPCKPEIFHSTYDPAE